MKSLVISFSYSGNTRQIADIIQKLTGAAQADIEVARPYPSEYNACVKQAEEEVKKGFEPEIKPLAVNIDDYDTAFIGTPVWWYTFSPPVRTVLSAWRWEGKTVYPFATHGGGIGSTFRDYQSF
ncbi:MAG: NAD(P)H-dependent oxidoreductase, partial [Deltaproteobacteria bacterium]|nr:NAD(P)H-dependent oxidoreductase [Deltaproteobacteria bacterium]